MHDHHEVTEGATTDEAILAVERAFSFARRLIAELGVQHVGIDVMYVEPELIDHYAAQGFTTTSFPSVSRPIGSYRTVRIKDADGVEVTLFEAEPGDERRQRIEKAA